MYFVLFVFVEPWRINETKLLLYIFGQTTFHYDSELWTNKNPFNIPGGETGFDRNQTKLPTYWNNSFSRICLGMKIDQQQLKFMVINSTEKSLYSLIADGNYRKTSLGRDTWKTLIGSNVTLQPYCNMEGFNAKCENVAVKTRIGILGNNEDDCNTCDSRIGFATTGDDDNNTCGNEATYRNIQHTEAMCYVLVQ